MNLLFADDRRIFGTGTWITEVPSLCSLMIHGFLVPQFAGDTRIFGTGNSTMDLKASLLERLE